MQHLSGPGDRIGAPAKGRPAAVVPLVLVVHGILHVRAEPEAGGEVGGDLAVGGHRLVRHGPALGGEGGQAGQPHGEGGI
jgi:hypothetical protein